MSVKALGIALKLTLSGMNQLIYPQTWLFTLVVAICVITQMNYLNKVTIVMPFFDSHLNFYLPHYQIFMYFSMKNKLIRGWGYIEGHVNF